MTATRPDRPDLPCTRAESCVVACAEAWRGAGEVMASPFGTIPSLGARLAKLTFAPDLVLTDGEAALMVGALPIESRAADLVREAAMPYRTVFDVVWSGRRHIMMMASQIDRTGNQNLSAIGPHHQPKEMCIRDRPRTICRVRWVRTRRKSAGARGATGAASSSTFTATPTPMVLSLIHI